LAACYFDVDGTLVRTNLIQPTLYYLLNQGTPVQTGLRLGRAFLRAPRMAWAELLDRRMFNELLYSAYAGMSEDRLVILADEVFDNVLRPSLFPAARELVDKSRSAVTIVYVSGALDVSSSSGFRAFSAGRGDRESPRDEERHRYRQAQRPIVAGPTKARLVSDHADPRLRSRRMLRFQRQLLGRAHAERRRSPRCREPGQAPLPPSRRPMLGRASNSPRDRPESLFR
jgi:hypothetical protein